MQDKEIIENLINRFVDLKRIINSDDSKKEAEQQLQIVKAKMEAMGIVTTKLEHIGE